MNITLDLDTTNHERQKEKGGKQEKNLPFTGSNVSLPSQDSSSKRFHHKKNKNDKQFQVSKENPHTSLLKKDNKLIGDMDLPPSSFCASLKQQRDEEELPEEIETVIKVVPPAYHQYLDVFSKVKAEKLPPHQSCSRHIKLGGL
ncbi:hypothetical protein O181_009209 [Austropuccinia psidii MF-1]|uniref:Uncharacterized protein n=1 Tax=Austropuccinia psidii MF-1 TaxID=1389203 RepID=A0A9Q3GJM1_9BASI|nr:hypothetical protein [Austropuccinia psidii MF-1]